MAGIYAVAGDMLFKHVDSGYHWLPQICMSGSDPLVVASYQRCKSIFHDSAVEDNGTDERNGVL